MGEMGLAKMGKPATIVAFFSHFPPLSYEFQTFFCTFPKYSLGNFSQFLIALPYPPFIPISPQFPPIPPPFPPFFHSPQFAKPLRLGGQIGCR